MKATNHEPHTHKHADECCDHEIKAVASHSHDDHDHEHDHDGESNLLKDRWPLWLSLSILFVFLIVRFALNLPISKVLEVGAMVVAYILAGYKTIGVAFRRVKRADFFNEFTLMTIATLGAFYIGEFSEGVAVMIFYEIGELIQDIAVGRSKRSIKALLDIRPDNVTVIKGSEHISKLPSEISVGDMIYVKAGERVALDGILTSESGTFNTAALTGESKPDTKSKGEAVFAGMINTDRPVEVEVSALFKDSKLSRILEMVQEATARKAPTQLMISRLAKIYTPIVFALAMLIIVVPALFTSPYNFNEWLYRGMVFLVIACPCALTISIPLGYFGGIGLASRNGILIKGSNFLDVITKIDTVVTDKTGTLTKGTFRVQEVECYMEKHEFLQIVASLERASTHPVAKAIVDHAADIELVNPTNVEEISGHGLMGTVHGQLIMAGNQKLMHKYGVNFPSEISQIAETTVLVAVDGNYQGYITIADEVKKDAKAMVSGLDKMDLDVVMLSGDKQSVTDTIAKKLGIRTSYGDLLPEGKVKVVEKLKNTGHTIAFVGDGINDAPVIALADVGIAMGGLGSDAAIETADIVIQNDQPSKIVSAIRAGKITKNVVYQNITLAMGIKIAVMVLGAGGIATLWEAVFADVGVALLAILNAYRIQGKKI